MLGMLVTAEAKAGVLKKENLRTSLVTSDYINQVEKKVEADLGSLLEERGIHPELAEDVLTYDAIYMDISNYMDAVFAGKQATLNTAEFEQNLQRTLNGYMEVQGAVLSDQVEKALTEVVTIAANSYQQYVTPKSIATLVRFRNEINHKVNLLGMISVVLTLVLTILLLCLYRYKHHGMEYLIYSAIAAVLVNGVGTLILAKAKFLERLGVGGLYYLEFIQEFLKGAIRECYLVTGIGAAIVLLLFLVRRFVRTISIK